MKQLDKNAPIEFKGESDDQPFKEWIGKNPHGYYLNKIGKIYRLHKVGCQNLGSGDWCIATNNKKIVDLSSEKLIRYVAGATIKDCTNCKTSV